jgi:hypothetical protein
MIDDKLVIFENVTREMETVVTTETTERIKASQWVKIENPSDSMTTETFYEVVSSTVRVQLALLDDLPDQKNETAEEVSVETHVIDALTLGSSTGNTSDDGQLMILDGSGNDGSVHLHIGDTDSHRTAIAISTVFSLFLILIILIILILYLVKLNRKTDIMSETPTSSRPVEAPKAPEPKRIFQSLPEIPTATNNPRKNNEGKDHARVMKSFEGYYDSPKSNVSTVTPYNYNFGTTISINGPRKLSTEHIYAEIQYPKVKDVEQTYDRRCEELRTNL